MEIVLNLMISVEKILWEKSMLARHDSIFNFLSKIFSFHIPFMNFSNILYALRLITTLSLLHISLIKYINR